MVFEERGDHGYKYQIILQKGFVIDPISKRNGIMDIGIANGKIVEIAPEINPTLAEKILTCTDYMIPGLVDLHTHASAWLGGKYGHRCLCQAGVTLHWICPGLLKVS